MKADFNPRLVAPDGSPLAAPTRGATERPDFRNPEDAPDPAAVTNEAHARAQAAADRRTAGIERARPRAPDPALPLAADARLAALERRVQSLEADAIVMRARITTLEQQAAERPSVSRMSRQDSGPNLPGAA